MRIADRKRQGECSRFDDWKRIFMKGNIEITTNGYFGMKTKISIDPRENNRFE